MNPFGVKDVVERIHGLLRLGTWVYSPQGEELWWSHETYRIHELEIGTRLTNELAASFFREPDLGVLYGHFARLREAGGRFDVEVAIVTAKGRTVQVRALGEALDRDGQRLIVGTFQDISETVAVRRQLQETTNFLQSVIENFPHTIFVKEPKELRYKIMNRAGEALLGCLPGEVLGRHDGEIFPPDVAQQFIAKDRQALLERQIIDIPEEPLETAGGRRYVHTTKMPVLDADGEPLFLLGVSEDITEQKRSRELIQKQQQALHNSAKMAALGEMASGIAHEVNNPLTVIQGYVYKARSLLADVSSETAVRTLDDQLSGIDGTVRRIASVIKGLRSYSRDTRSSPVQSVGLSELVEDLLALCREKFRTHGIELRKVDGAGGALVHCRASDITQALLHLINNAFDAIRGSVGAWVEVSTALRADAAEVAITVTDSGRPIPERVRAKIFQPFFTTKDVGTGIGLGLGLARGLAEAHGGRLTIEDGEHPRFVMVLPTES